MTQQMEARLESAMAAARAAGKVIKEAFGKTQKHELKGPRDLVTEVDRQCELLIKSKLQGCHPELEFWGEEFGGSCPPNQLAWVVDPLDGTKNFVHGYPFVAVSIALVRNGRSELGVVYDPLRDEMFHAQKGHGAFREGQRLEVSNTTELSEALVVTGLSLDSIRQKEHLLAACVKCRGLRRGGASALDLCQLAAGRIDAMWEWRLKPWDLAAAVLMIEEAQGTVTSVDGSTFDLHSGQILATNTSLHREVVEMLTE